MNSDGWAGLGKLCTVEKIFINLFFFFNITAILLCHVCVGGECPHGANSDLWPSPGRPLSSWRRRLASSGSRVGGQRPAGGASVMAAVVKGRGLDFVSAVAILQLQFLRKRPCVLILH